MEATTTQRALVPATPVATTNSALAPVPDAAREVPPICDADILQAFEVYRTDPVEGGPNWRNVRIAEEILLSKPVTTQAGLEAKLRVVIDCCGGESWFSEEARQPIGTPLVERGPIDDFGDRMLFRAAQEAIRLAGSGRA